ncbi:MAG TPA: sigma-70 family RNA polymerase sigma factor [Pyrinomonadaceae bacterium]|nr:sigma-70 family RNA polymerase sigma factor [Pyrinomonadaceae bacterium]
MTEESSTHSDVTRLLAEWGDGDEAALARLMPLVYDELRRLARHYMRRERPGHTIEPTALVNEAYLRLVEQTNIRWQNRAHFFGIAANVMRRVLCDHARARLADKRGGGAVRVSLVEAEARTDEQTTDVLALDEALGELAGVDPRKARVVELRYFGGLSVEETAEVLKVSRSTVLHDWNMAKAWLYQQMKSE